MNAVAETFWNTLPLGRDVAVLKHDPNGLAALAKPAGTLSHPNKADDEPRSLLNASYAVEGEVYRWSDAAGAMRQLWLLNRLDSATSGVILAAASAELATAIRAHFKKKRVHKIYYALVFGTPPQPVALWRDLIAVDKRGGKIRTDARAGNIPAECQMSVARSRPGAEPRALLKLEPWTGRSHQLRVQCAKRHLPIVGDQTYGDFTRNREFAKQHDTKRLFLHSLETNFDYEWNGRSFEFGAKAALPPEFEKFL